VWPSFRPDSPPPTTKPPNTRSAPIAKATVRANDNGVLPRPLFFIHRKPHRQNDTRAHLQRPPPTKAQSSRAARPLTQRSPPLTAATNPASPPTVSHDRPTTQTATTKQADKRTRCPRDVRDSRPNTAEATSLCGRESVRTARQRRSAKQPATTHTKRNSRSKRRWDTTLGCCRCLFSSSRRKLYW
jgi:hypothetical protein